MSKDEYTAYIKAKYGDSKKEKVYLKVPKTVAVVHKVNGEKKINVLALKQKRD